MEHAVAFMIGSTALVAGASLFTRWEDWAEYLRYIRSKGKPAALMLGYIHLLIGGFIVGFHWKWHGLPLLLTLLGVKAMMEGVVYTIFPNAMLAMLAWYEPRIRGLLRITGLLCVAIGVLVLREWWPYAHAAYWYPEISQATMP